MTSYQGWPRLLARLVVPPLLSLGLILGALGIVSLQSWIGGLLALMGLGAVGIGIRMMARVVRDQFGLNIEIRGAMVGLFWVSIGVVAIARWVIAGRPMGMFLGIIFGISVVMMVGDLAALVLRRLKLDKSDL